MKKYFQEAFRDGQGSVLIKQYSETERPSGLLIPDHIGNVAIVPSVTSSEIASQISSSLTIASGNIAPTMRQIESLSIPSELPQIFRNLSIRAITDAYRALSYGDSKANIVFGVSREEGVAKDDVAFLKDLSSSTLATIEDKDDVPIGQFL